jgi:hypothetical protein
MFLYYIFETKDTRVLCPHDTKCDEANVNRNTGNGCLSLRVVSQQHVPSLAAKEIVDSVSGVNPCIII